MNGFDVPDSEWSSVYVGTPPESVQGSLEEVLDLVSELPLAQDDPPRGQTIPDRPRAVTILGGRGTGKSTLLYFAADALRNRPEHFVTPIIDPESFAPGDTLAGWVLAHLDREIADGTGDFELGPDFGNRTLGQLSEELRRAQAVRAGGYLPGLNSRGLNFDDFARDAVKVPGHGIQMARRVAEFLNGMAKARAMPRMKVIIPVDDADLFPELLPAIVADAQMLGASNRVAVIFAADMKTLTSALQVAFLSGPRGVSQALATGLMTPQYIRELTGLRIVKHFPRSLRVYLSSLSPEARLSFFPLGGASRTPLTEVLRQFRIPDGSDRTLSDLFEIKDTSGRTLAISPYISALTANPREARQLYEALTHLDASEEWSASAALGLVMTHGFESLEPDLPSSVMQAVRLESPRDVGPPIARFNFSGIELGKSVRGGSLIFQRDEDPAPGNTGAHQSPEGPVPPLSDTVVLRPVDRHYSRPRATERDEKTNRRTEAPPGDGENTVTEGEAAYLPAQFTHLALLAWEATQAGPDGKSLFTLDGYFNRPTLSGGANWENCVAGSPSTERWAYWRIPAWEGYTDYFTFEVGWARYLAAVDALPGRSVDNLAIMEMSLLVHLDLIVTVQAERAVPAWIADLEENGLQTLYEAWLAGDRGWRDNLAHRLVDLYEVLRNNGDPATMRDDDYVTWFMLDLPICGTPLLSPSSSTEWLINLWRENVPEAIRFDCASRVATLARDHITTYLADGDIQLLEAVEPYDHRGEQASVLGLRNVRTEFARQSAQKQLEALRYLESQDFDRRLIEILKTQGATREVLLGLIQADLPPAFVTVVAEAFPAPAEPVAEPKVSGQADNPTGS